MSTLQTEDIGILRTIFAKEDEIWKAFYPKEHDADTGAKNIHNSAVWLSSTVRYVLGDITLSGTLEERLEKIKDILDGPYYDRIAEIIDLEHLIAGAKASIDLDAALASVTRGSELSALLDYGLSDRELIDLGRLHEMGLHRKKIEDLLTDINFHYECGLLKEGNYSEFWKGTERERD